MSTAKENLLRLFADHNALASAISLMNWDRQVLMPPGGATARTAHVGILTSKAHALFTGDEFARALEAFEAEAQPGSEDVAMAAALRREVDIETKLPQELIKRHSRVSSDAYETWKTAKATNNFPLLAPFYEQLFDIAGETAGLLGYTNHIYDPLIDMYEQGATYSDAEAMFQGIKQPIVDLVRKIREEGTPVDDAALVGDWDKEALRLFSEQTISAIGFDLDRGRLNLAPNAFCSGTSCSDIRMTTRASEHLKGIVSSSLHEMGHALYEQNSPLKWDRTPLAGGISLAVHESQSRLWENIVGRSRGFWTYFLPKLQASFPRLGGLDVDSFYRALNKVEPDFIRVGADELTYNLHILVRFEIEVEILTGQVKIKDLPEAWNAKYTDYLGITPPTDTLGCLQDVHWSRGSVGYFPTYSMGNLIGGQMWKCVKHDLGDTDSLMAKGEFAPILGWLTDKVYQHARSIPPRELVTQVTGRPMEPTDWLAYATAKYSDIYGL